MLIGGMIGLVSAVAGAVIDYGLSRNRAEPDKRRLPGCMLLMAGALGLTGIAAACANLLLTGGVREAMFTGIGVIGGFFSGFVVLFVAWLILDS